MLREKLGEQRDDGQAPEPIEGCAQLSLRLGKLGHVDALGVVHEPDPDVLDPVQFVARLASLIPPPRHPLVRYFGRPVPEPEPASEGRSRGRLQAATRYIPWADLLKRVHDIDALECPRCGGRLDDPPPPADYDAA
ncbi:MAG: hypothetical protein HY898_10370 [Deltaproteobacteria bacterium]|nr:hypothetical protein [Deltaproteobacteria bacterium]